MPESNEPVRAASLDVRLTDLVLPVGLKLNSVRLVSGPMQLAEAPQYVRLERPGELEVTVSREGLQAFVVSQMPSMLRDVQVQFEEGLVVVSASVRVVFEVRATAKCRLTVVAGRELIVELMSVEPGLAENIVRTQLEQANPVFRASDLPVPVELTQAIVEQGQVVVRGRVSAP